MAGYWERVLNRRITRRRGMALAGGSAAAAAFLAACGGDDDDGGDGGDDLLKRDSSGLLSPIEDTTKQAKTGGILKVDGGEPLHFDGGVQGQGQLNIYNAMAYSSLVGNKPGFKVAASFTEVVPDLAQSWEFSPDGQTLTFKLKQNVTFANTPPVNGRGFDSGDVVKTWERYESVGGNRAANANKVNPGAPILSVTAPDKYTVVYKLSRPSSFIMQRLANLITGEAGTMFPKEVDSGFDPKKDQIGTGGFVRESFQPSVGLKYRKRPGYHLAPEPYIDGIDYAILPEYATRLAQFKAGNLHLTAQPVLPQDVVITKKDAPRLALYPSLLAGINPLPMMRFGWKDVAGQKSPFKDVRVRRAMSMSQDREAFINAFGNVDKFSAEGLPVDTYYFTAQGYVPNVTLDPRDKSKFGPNAQYYEFNQEEAKKLLNAAYPGGSMPQMEVAFNTIAFFGADHANQVQVLTEMANEVGFKLKTRGIDYNLEYLPNFVTKQGNHEGIVFAWGASTSSDPIDYYVWRYWSKSGPTSGALGFGGPDGSLGDQSGDPQVDSLIEKGMLETENNARVKIIEDLQKHLAGQQYGVTRPGIASGFTPAWPAVANFLVHQGGSRGGGGANDYYTWWLDQTKAPFV